MTWLFAAFGSALFAGLTSILAKCGIRHTDSDTATFIRTVIVLIFSWLMVYLVGSFYTLHTISTESFIFLILSGIATGASWICYFKALSLGDVNKVVPIDKSSTVLTVLSAIILFGETHNLWLKLAAITVLGIGTWLMIDRKPTDTPVESKYGWLFYAILSAIFASATAIFGKIGIDGVESNLGTAIRTCVVLIMSWIVLLIKGKTHTLRTVPQNELGFLLLSGLATGASWLCYYYAIQNGIVSVVIPIDKMSILISILFSYLIFKETLTKRSFTGLVLMTVATLCMILFT